MTKTLRTAALALLVLAGGIHGACALDADTEQRDRAEMRRLMVAAKDGINARKFDEVKGLLAKDFVLTMINGERLTNLAELDDYLSRWFVGPARRIDTIHMEPGIDRPATFLDDTHAFARGTNHESYGMVYGRTHDFDSLWTANLVKEDGAWKLSSYQGSVSFVDNPLMHDLERSLTWWMVGGAAVGLLSGLGGGWLLRRSRRPKAA